MRPKKPASSRSASGSSGSAWLYMPVFLCQITDSSAGAGLLSGSLALLSEAAHALVDTAATIMTYLAIRTANKPADEEHQYGTANSRVWRRLPRRSSSSSWQRLWSGRRGSASRPAEETLSPPSSPLAPSSSPLLSILQGFTPFAG